MYTTNEVETLSSVLEIFFKRMGRGQIKDVTFIKYIHSPHFCFFR